MLLVTKLLARRKPLLRNWFRACGGGAAGCLEGWNSNKALTLKKVFAFQSFNVANVALLQSFGNPFNPTSQRQFPGKCQCF